MPPPAAAPDPYIGTIVDNRYRIESLLGEGGMGVVYLARHQAIDKKMALKVLRSDLARDNTEIQERFLQEARAASSIGNPHIVDISDFGQFPDGSAYFVMEYLEGAPLSKILEETRPLPLARACHIAWQICNALAAAHEIGIVHRDLKPDNVFLIRHGQQEDFVKVLDFGIAKVSTSGSKLTRAGAVFGTPHYMSPEQAAGSAVDSRTDIYSIGVMLYEMASGEVPFDADNFMGILTQHMYKAPVPIRALVPPRDISPGLEAIILKCLSKTPDQRYQHMAELAADLDKAARGLVPDAVPELMARSGGFHVPADYFKDRGMPAALPATPHGLRKRTPWGLYAGIAGVLAAVLIVVGIFARSSDTTASVSSVPAPPKPTEKAEEAPIPAAVDEEPQASEPAQPRAHQVLFASNPLDAHVFRDNEDLGQPPLTLEIPEGETVTVEVRREGYESRTVTVDGSQERMTVTLSAKPTVPAKAAPAKKAPQKRPATQDSPGIGSSGIVNPWAN